MEESVWIYIGVLATIITIGVLVGVISRSNNDSSKEQFFNAIEQLGEQARIVCAAPKDTMLSIRMTVPAGARMSAQESKVCGEVDSDIRCAAVDCSLNSGVILDLTTTNLFREHVYSCAVRHADTIEISCQG